MADRLAGPDLALHYTMYDDGIHARCDVCGAAVVVAVFDLHLSELLNAQQAHTSQCPGVWDRRAVGK